jgi:hypothetical protein
LIKELGNNLNISPNPVLIIGFDFGLPDHSEVNSYVGFWLLDGDIIREISEEESKQFIKKGECMWKMNESGHTLIEFLIGIVTLLIILVSATVGISILYVAFHFICKF